MRISVVAREGLGGPEGPRLRQVRAYAEFRMFSALVLRGGGQDIHEVVVVLIPSEGGDGAVTCTVSAAGADGEAIRVSAPGRHVYDAIDRAASRIRRRTWAPKREVM